MSSYNQVQVAPHGRDKTRGLVRDAFLRAVSESISPDEVVGAFRRAVEYADARKDAKAMVQVLELLLSYSIGRPSPWEERSTGDINKILAIIPPEMIRQSFLSAAHNEEYADATGQSISLPEEADAA